MSAIEDIGQVTTVASSHDLSIISLIMSADMVGKLVIFCLIFASIWSWAIIISKLNMLRSMRKKMTEFEGVFWSGQVLDDLYERVKKKIDNPLTIVFISAMNECKRVRVAGKTDALKSGHKERVLQSMYLACSREMEVLGARLSVLAMIGSSAPFIGLFGTVWGIMHSFQSIAASKNTTLAVVAPGIAEALLATAIGLAAAIPAYIFYNHLSSEVDSVNSKVEDFIGELNTLLSRAIDEDKM